MLQSERCGGTAKLSSGAGTINDRDRLPERKRQAG